MTRPLQFPRGFPWLIAAVVMFSGLPMLALAAWFWYVTPPLQSYYLMAYFESTERRNEPAATTKVEWLYKTAPRRKAALVSEADIVSAPNAKGNELPVELSPRALADGWRGVVKSAPQRVNSAELERYLEAEVYEGNSLWRMLLLPLLEFAAAIFFLLAIRAWWAGKSRHEERHGRRTKGPELFSAFGWSRAGKADGIRFQLRWPSRWAGWLPFGPGYRVPRRLEPSHILLMGDTGSGKSSAIRQLLRQVERRGESAIVYDPAMDFVAEFYSPQRGDLILNPLDTRCPCWALGDELLRQETATTMAAAFLPEKEYEKEFFTDGPRRILAHLLKLKPHSKDILKWMSDPSHIEFMVKGTPLAALIDPAAPAQRAGVISSLNMVADSLELLPDWYDAQGKTFSTAEWYSERKRWVFLTSSPDYREKILPLHSVWLDLLILRMMGYCEDQAAKPVWFVLDELASLNKLPQLHTALTESRKYGNPVVLGFQGRSQLEKRYGPDAEAMLSQPATKVFFKTSEPRAAKWISDAIGEIEVERLKESSSMGLFRRKSYALEIATKPLVMASEISGLEPLRAFIKQENRVVPVRFALAKKRAKHPEFIERKMPELIPRKKVEAPPPVPAAQPSPPKKKPVAASQAALPLSPAPAAKPKEAFLWDESKGID